MNPAAPRSARQLIGGTVDLYRRYPLLFAVLATGVIVPYQVIVLVVTGSSPVGGPTPSLGVTALLTLLEWALISPLVSSLHVHAVREAREGKGLRLASVAKQGLRPLPIVVAASIISGLGIAAGLVAFILPGIFLMLRWAVVAQSAAVEQEGWLPALRRSGQLTDGNYGHVFAFFVYLSLVTSVPVLLVSFGFGEEPTTAASFLVGLLVQIFALSFGALATALLYFDLRTRREASVALEPGPAAGTDHSVDPRAYSNQTRPKGWYIDPSQPNRMRYWGAGDPLDWGGSTRTPRRVRRAWQESQDR